MIAGLIICASLSVYDGDTIKCNGYRMRLLGEGRPFHSGIDTPEIGKRARCPQELSMGLAAKERLQELLDDRKLRIVFSGSHDRAGRPLINIYRADGLEVGKTLLNEGFAREWRPKHRNDWCF
ncbi:thermonuclease family protein [Rhizobium leguminosarum]|uniref:thermonuclease family protein n=1 Tax=Rhizobium leguminosarum TaxID=384 RepID=UPI001031E99A|nr:thermonuclease family protein [Rhizobium leguminosarum]TBG38536.1 thermonuclease family protein [Rhizobium leguminosarum]